MLWYLLKTWTGREEELAKEIRRTVPPYMYEDVFVINTERVWRRQGRSIIHPEPMFAGCVFLSCRETEPLFLRLDQIPFLSRQMALGYLVMLPLREEDAEFLMRISGPDHLVRLSYVLREREENAEVRHADRMVYRVSGPLEFCIGDIETFEFRKRFVKLKKRLWGEELVIPLGLILNEDLGQKIACENMEITAEIPKEMSRGYTVMEIVKNTEGKKIYTGRRPDIIHDISDAADGGAAGYAYEERMPA